MIVSPTELSSSEAERLRAFERQGHDALAKSYHAFFAAVTALATNPLFDDVHLRPGTRLLDVASGPGALTAEAANRGARSVGVDFSPPMIELAQRRTEVKVTEHAATYFVPDTETLWRGGLGSLVLTGAVIRKQDQATQDLIRTAFERCASVYRSADGLNLPIAFKIGSGQRPS